MLDRRAFLASSGVVAWGATLPTFVARAAAAAPALDKRGARDTILVVVELTGGNDGLNTLVPYADPAYYALRPKIAIARGEAVQLSDRAGLHPALAPLTTIAAGASFGFTLQIVLWLWATVLFATFAEAVAEGRGKAQADSLRRTRSDILAKLIVDAKTGLMVPTPALELQPGQIVLVEAGDLIPSDGEVIEGIASVNEAAITGESAPVIRESGGDRSAVTGGTRGTARKTKRQLY